MFFVRSYSGRLPRVQFNLSRTPQAGVILVTGAENYTVTHGGANGEMTRRQLASIGFQSLPGPERAEQLRIDFTIEG